jgi:hypothetical protein
MQLAGRPVTTPPPTDLAAVLRSGTTRLGHRPAITVLHPGARYEQSGTSLANWAAKGAHVLELDHLVGPDVVVDLDAPACWTVAAAALATWWLGGAVRVAEAAGSGLRHAGATTDQAGATGEPAGTGRPAVTVRHEATLAAWNETRDGPTLVVGDTLDGGPTGPAIAPVWTHEAQPMPDAPPASGARADGIALLQGARSWSPREVIDLAGSFGDGVLGVEVARVDPALALVATAVRPFLTGWATVVLRGVDRDAAAAERISSWCAASAG